MTVRELDPGESALAFAALGWHDAHRLYLNHRLQITAHDFRIALGESGER